MKNKFILSALVLTAMIATAIMVRNHRGTTRVADVPPVSPPPATAPVVTASSVSDRPDSRPAPAPVPVTAPAESVPKALALAPAPTATGPTEASLTINGYEVQDPLARLALAGVGSDSDATTYWLNAINDPDLPAEERKDLIEDLNEDGLENPHLATSSDLPVIANRINLVKQIASRTVDPVNARALAEAYKDLVNLYNGRPAD